MEFFVPNRGVAPKELYALFINDDESGLHHDYEVWLEKLAPHAPTSAYRQNRTGELRKRSRAGTTPTRISSARSGAAKS